MILFFTTGGNCLQAKKLPPRKIFMTDATFTSTLHNQVKEEYVGIILVYFTLN